MLSRTHYTENTRGISTLYTLLSVTCVLVGWALAVVALTLSPLAAVVRFSSGPSRRGTWGFRLWIRVLVWRLHRHDALHARLDGRLPKEPGPSANGGGATVGQFGSQILVSQLGIGKHQLDSHTALAAAVSSPKAGLPLTLTHLLVRSRSLIVLALSSRSHSRVLEYVYTPRCSDDRTTMTMTDEARWSSPNPHRGLSQCYSFSFSQQGLW